jgi:glutamine cyclotransferase
MNNINSFFKRKNYKIILIFGLLLFIFEACDNDEIEPAKFKFKENLALNYNSETNIEIEIFKNNLKSVELEISGKIVHKWDKPNSNVLKYNLKANDFGIGGKNITLIVTDENNEIFKDERLLRIFSDIKPKIWNIEIISTIPHNISNFTQGFEFDNNQLFESTGQYGESKISKIDIKTGLDINKIQLDDNYFGEGITILNDTIYQLTWTENKCFLYNKNTLELLSKNFTYKGEGWGICNDGKYLIMSDGSERITFKNPQNFETVKIIEVYTNDQPVSRLNEIEYINGYIYANIWMSNNIVIIEPENGRVIAVIDGTKLASIGKGKIGEAFNGIAYNKNEDIVYVTGKNWEKIIKIKIHKD